MNEPEYEIDFSRFLPPRIGRVRATITFVSIWLASAAMGMGLTNVFNALFPQQGPEVGVIVTLLATTASLWLLLWLIVMRRWWRVDDPSGTEIAERRAESIRRAQEALDAVEWRNQLQRHALRKQGLLPADPAADAAWKAMNDIPRLR
jgi:hypothetical protein